MDYSTLILSAGILILLYGILSALQEWTQCTDEPPMAETSVPFIGSILQMMKQKTGFYLQMKAKYQFPIYTLRMPWARIYVVNDASLISSVQRQFRALNFPVIMGKAIGKIAGTSPATNEIMNRDWTTDDGFLVGFNKAIHSTLNNGPDLDRLNRESVQSFATSIDEFSAGGPRSVPLFSWVRSQVVLGTTDAVYGPFNPFRDPEIERDWYTFEPGVTTLALKFIPNFLNGKTVQARERIVKAFLAYFRGGHHESGSGLVKARYDYIVKKHKIHDLVDVARLEVAGAFGTISNSSPTAFWLLYHLFSNPHILEDCRQELSTLVEERDGICYLDTNGIPKQCPTTLSSFNEVLRYHGIQVSLRKVVEDHVLEDKYLLKKGSALMMPATVQHFEPLIWGPNSNEFDHKRFMPNGTEGYKRGAQRAAFRGFGGGHHLCPGRHFATTEIVAFAALIILRFDITPVRGTWTELRTDKLSSKGSAVTLPDNDLEVMVTPRDTKVWVLSKDSM